MDLIFNKMETLINIETSANCLKFFISLFLLSIFEKIILRNLIFEP